MVWWQRGIVYEVYARSFQDSDADGTGDLPGITRRLDHLAWLGVDAVWITPVYPSPMADFGYDVADYTDIDPLFGTLAAFDALVARAHALGLRVILDFVPNHTSNRHPWFEESRDPDSAKRDWYLWHDAAPGEGPPSGRPPNNWQSNFGGPAWTWDERRGQFYYHSFLAEQPDLNWRNPDVKAAMFDAMRVWLRRGVDGFRVDVMWMLIKDDQYRDNPPDPAAPGHLLPLYTTDRPEVQDVVTELRAVTDTFPDRVLIGELYLPIERTVAYYGRNLDGAQLPYNFQLLLLNTWSAAAVADIVVRYEAALPSGAWPNWVLGNHDRPRIASRVGPAQARVAAMLLLTLRGTPTIYMGEELGMVDTALPRSALRDPAELRDPGKGQGRDPQRTPFPWTGGAGAGFTTGTPWLPIGTDTPLDRQAADPNSMVSLYRKLIALRRSSAALVEGAIADVRAVGPVLSYQRRQGGERLLIALNLSDASAELDVQTGTIVLGTYDDRRGEPTGPRLALRANEGVVVRL